MASEASKKPTIRKMLKTVEVLLVVILGMLAIKGGIDVGQMVWDWHTKIRVGDCVSWIKPGIPEYPRSYIFKVVDEDERNLTVNTYHVPEPDTIQDLRFMIFILSQRDMLIPKEELHDFQKIECPANPERPRVAPQEAQNGSIVE